MYDANAKVSLMVENSSQMWNNDKRRCECKNPKTYHEYTKKLYLESF